MQSTWIRTSAAPTAHIAWNFYEIRRIRINHTKDEIKMEKKRKENKMLKKIKCWTSLERQTSRRTHCYFGFVENLYIKICDLTWIWYSCFFLCAFFFYLLHVTWCSCVSYRNNTYTMQSTQAKTWHSANENSKLTFFPSFSRCLSKSLWVFEYTISHLK